MNAVRLPTLAARSLAMTLFAVPIVPTFAQEEMEALEGFERVELAASGETLVCMTGGEGPDVLLLHGWPQTAAEWKPVAPSLAERYTVHACDLPGIRDSTNADDDFTKADMAADIHAAFTGAGVGPMHLVGHDIGLMVAYAYASDFPDDVLSLTVMDAPLPGTPAYDYIANDPRAWHFAFHGAPEVPERIVGNDVAYYVEHFIASLWAGEGGPPEEAVRPFVEAYSDPETLRSGFEFYRAFGQDAEDNATRLETPLAMPVLALNAGALSPEPYVLEMMRPLAEDVRGGAVDGSGHWLTEEVPDEIARQLLDFLETVR